MSYNTLTKTYEINAPEESIQLIKVQNKKIKELYNEIDIKDNLLRQYEEQIRKSKNCFEQNNQMKIQIEKLLQDLKEKQAKVAFNEKNVSDYAKKEQNLSSQISNMKTAYETEIGKYIEDLKTKSEKIKNLEEENEKIKQSGNLNLLKLDKLEKENVMYVEKINQYVINEKGFQSRAKELVDIIQTQDKEIKNFQNEIALLKENNSKYSNENLKLKNLYSTAMKNVSELEEKNKESENIILTFNNELQNEKNKVFELTTSMNKVQNDLSVMKLKLNEQIAMNKEKDKTLSQMNQEKNNLLYTIDKAESNLKSYDTNISHLISYISSLIDTSMKWSDTYICNFHSGNDIPSLEDKFPSNGVKDRNEKILFEIVSKVNRNIKEIFNRTNDEYKKYDKIISEYESEKQSKLLQLETMNKKLYDTEEKLKLFVNEKNTLKSKDCENSEMINAMNAKLVSLSKANEQYETEIISFYKKICESLNTNKEKLCQNESYRNVFSNVDIEKPEDNVINKLIKVKEISFDFIDVTLCLVQLLKEKEKIISEFSAINEECANLRKEIIEIKKSSSSQTNNIMKEKDSMMTSFEKNKISEIAKIESELRNKIERLELILKEKEEEIEKLNNDNNLLYSQYLLSEKNFEEYKNNRKSYDAELQRKYEEIQRKFIDTESEKNQIQKEIDIMNVKMKNIEASYNSKSKENEALKIKVNELVKNSII